MVRGPIGIAQTCSSNHDTASSHTLTPPPKADQAFKNVRLPCIRLRLRSYAQNIFHQKNISSVTSHTYSGSHRHFFFCFVFLLFFFLLLTEFKDKDKQPCWLTHYYLEYLLHHANPAPIRPSTGTTNPSISGTPKHVNSFIHYMNQLQFLPWT